MGKPTSTPISHAHIPQPLMPTRQIEATAIKSFQFSFHNCNDKKVSTWLDRSKLKIYAKISRDIQTSRMKFNSSSVYFLISLILVVAFVAGQEGDAEDHNQVRIQSKVVRISKSKFPKVAECRLSEPWTICSLRQAPRSRQQQAASQDPSGRLERPGL